MGVIGERTLAFGVRGCDFVVGKWVIRATARGSSAQIAAPAGLGDRDAPSSQRGGPKPLNFTPGARCLLTVC